MKRWVDMLAALGQEARLEIFRLLVRAGPEGRCVENIRRRVEMPGSTLSHHLDTLTRSGLLCARREGRFIHYAVDWREANSLVRFLTEDCCVDPSRCTGAGALPAERTSIAKPRAPARQARRSRG
jgi:DNA-binding transcriptional ArsR family regulator